jgi:hypothetical protein
MTHRHLAAALICVISLLATACDAQKASSGGASYSEPALIGKVIDQETKKPIEGAVIYGHYATSSGTLAGGSKFGEHVKSFEAVTDANGNFKLDAWSTDKKISGQPNGKFPLIAVWKPGYGLEIQNLNSIREFQPRTTAQGSGEAKVANNVVDWSAVAFELKATKTEIERRDALANAGYPMLSMGECGWELYSNLVSSMHVETINMKRRLIPKDKRREDDMPREAYPLGASNRSVQTSQIEELLINHAPLHRLRDEYKRSTTNWKCSNPENLLLAIEPLLIKETK